MRFNILFGGKAGQGPNILSEIVSQGLIKKGYYVFYSRDYQSLIRGGHNFNVISFSENPVYSNTRQADILVCLDENTEKIHKAELKKGGIILGGDSHNMFFAGALFKILDIDFKILEEELKKLNNLEENMKEAKMGYTGEKRILKFAPGKIGKNPQLMNGNQGICSGAIDSGLDYYYAYPMTPATPVMMELAQLQMEKKNKHRVIELENEIAVMLAAEGSSIAGAKSMVGTSGGGFDLMTEGLSLAGIAEIPIVIYMSQRPGPATGLATYSGQGDLNLCLHSGHGEFSRVVIAPGDPIESTEATNQCFYLSQKFRIPAFILGDKHLAESKSIAEETPRIIEVKNSITKPERFNSYEHDENGTATEDAKLTKKNVERRLEKHKTIAKEAELFPMYKIHGNKNSKNLIIGWGSTKGAILDAINEGKIDAKFLQTIYMEPFSSKIGEIIKQAKNVMIVENNSTSQLSRLIAEKTGFMIDNKNRILRYDGRPFLSDELAEEIRRRLK